jgi:hypothetical protein
LSDKERLGLLSRLYDGDPFVGVELRRLVRDSVAESTGIEPPKARSVGELRARAAEIAATRKRAAAAAVRVERERRNAAGYDRAKAILADLRDVASSQGKMNEFERRVDALRQKHARKGQFIDRLRSFAKS